MSKRPFDKPATTYQTQISLLQSRGMIVSDVEEAILYLKHINYYRLAAYWLPFEADHASHQFKPGTSFSQVLNHYIFDRELRLLVLDAIERIEVSIRAQWAYYMAHLHGTHSHLNPTLASNLTRWQENLQVTKKETERAEEVFIKHLLQKYSEELPPIWATCEIMSMGLLSKWYFNLKPAQTRKVIADVYGIQDSVLASWLHHLSLVRNVAAHHSRLWNREFPFTPRIPKNKPLRLSEEFDHTSRNLYNTLVILAYLLDKIAPHHHFRTHLKALIAKHPGLLLEEMGFLKGWESRAFWNE